ncbi:MAG: glycosyltransferase family 4 protein [Actinobacteria bacterium]|nr:glycosyltransferase family 4 protein [Actinomycetota bacterium]
MTDASPPRVALVAHRYASHLQSGIPRYVAELCRVMSADPACEGYALITPPERGDTSGCGLPVEHLRGPRRVVQLGWHAAGRPALEQLVAPAALVHVLYPFAPVPTRAPLIATVHDLLPLRHPEWFGRVNAAKFRRATDVMVRDATHVITDSASVSAQVQESLAVDPDRITVVPLGVAPAFRERVAEPVRLEMCARHGVTPGRFFIAVGYVSLRKNLLTILRALAVAGGHLRLPLLLAGPAGRGAGDVQREVERLGLQGRVIVTGWLAEQELASLVASATALLHPATHEGFGLPPLEAMAAGTPVVASTGGAVPEVVGRAGLLLDHEDVDGWADAMVRLAGDGDLVTTLRTKGLVQSAPYTWERTAAETLAVHRRVLSRD